MTFSASSCERCPHIALISSEDCIDGKALCAACGGLVSVLPGDVFTEGDVPLFDELCRHITDVEIAGREAQQLAIAIEESALLYGEKEALSVLMFWVPGLKALHPLLVASPARARRVCAMVGAILCGRAERRDSRIVDAHQKKPKLVAGLD